MGTCAISFKLASSIVFHSPTDFLWIVHVLYQSCPKHVGVDVWALSWRLSCNQFRWWSGWSDRVRVLVCCSVNKVLVPVAIGVISIVFLSSAHLLISVPTQCLREASMLCNLPFFSPTIWLPVFLPGNWPLPVGRHVFTWYFEVSSCWLCVDCCSGKLLWSAFRSTRCLALVLCDASFSQIF